MNNCLGKGTANLGCLIETLYSFHPQFALQQLSNFRLGEHIAELYVLGNLVRSQPLTTPFNQIITCDPFDVFLQDNERFDSFSYRSIRDSDHTGANNSRMLLQRCLDLR